MIWPMGGGMRAAADVLARATAPPTRSGSRGVQTPVRGIRAPGSFPPRSWRAGRHGRANTPRRASGPRRRLQVATARSPRCRTPIAACPGVAPRCGRRGITSMVELRTGRHRRRDVSGGRVPLSLRACSRRSTRCPCQGNAVRPSRYVLEGTKCPGLNGYPAGKRSPNNRPSASIGALNGLTTAPPWYEAPSAIRNPGQLQGDKTGFTKRGEAVPSHLPAHSWSSKSPCATSITPKTCMPLRLPHVGTLGGWPRGAHVRHSAPHWAKETSSPQRSTALSWRVRCQIAGQVSCAPVLRGRSCSSSARLAETPAAC
jgi:hypothetical protein